MLTELEPSISRHEKPKDIESSAERYNRDCKRYREDKLGAPSRKQTDDESTH